MSLIYTEPAGLLKLGWKKSLQLANLFCSQQYPLCEAWCWLHHIQSYLPWIDAKSVWAKRGTKEDKCTVGKMVLSPPYFTVKMLFISKKFCKLYWFIHPKISSYCLFCVDSCYNIPIKFITVPGFSMTTYKSWGRVVRESAHWVVMVLFDKKRLQVSISGLPENLSQESLTIF